jgi:uncharacterized repeat protein (TIGR01451 family)
VYVVTQADVDAGSLTNHATASGQPPTGDRVTAEGSTTATATPAPSLTVAKSSTTASYALGMPIEYRFVVTNTGNVTLTGIAVDDALLDAPATCPVTVLAPGASTTCTGVRTATQADVDRGSLTNTATAGGTPPGGGRVTSPPSSVSVPAVAPAPGVALQKSAAQGTFTAAGQPATFTFLVTNTGNVTLSGVAVNDPLLDAPATCPVTDLAPGESTTCTGVRTITAGDVATGGVVNTATVSVSPPGGGTPLESAPDTATMQLVVTPPVTPPPATTVPPPNGGELPATGGGGTPIALLATAVLALGAVLLGIRRLRRTTA